MGNDHDARERSTAYRAARKIAVVDGRLAFQLAYCLTKLVSDHAGARWADVPAQTVVVEYFEVGRRRMKADWYVEVTQQGLDLVLGAGAVASRPH